MAGPARPLLIFNSGVGGLSVLGPARALPEAPIVYAADSAGYPYGTRSAAEIASAGSGTCSAGWPSATGPALIVIACNTASTIALDAVRAALDLPIVGTVPAIKPAAELSRTRVIGVLGTEATVRQPYVDELAAAFAADCTVIRHGTPELVELAEAKLAGETISVEGSTPRSRRCSSQPGGEKIDTVVLACTHFPLLARRALPPPARRRFVDGGPGSPGASPS